MAELTPMMQQYNEIKAQNPDALLFFRLGDFYEMFGDDARLASAELDLTLTSRDHGKHQKPKEEQIPMCGVPYHACDAYIARLVEKGYKVAICEQTEDPALAKGLVKRDIIRVVTPGTLLDSASLEEKGTNYLCGIFADETSCAVAFCDLSTGETALTGFTGEGRMDHLFSELGRFTPSEAVVNETAAADASLLELLTGRLHCRIEQGRDERFAMPEAEKLVRRQFGDEAFRSIPAALPAAVQALGGLLRYLYETQRTDLSYIHQLRWYEQGRFMELDLTARRNLELTETLRSKEKRGSLLWVLDKTKTPMGGRLLKRWIQQPLLSVAQIRRRSGAIEALRGESIALAELREALSGLGDMERLIGRIVYGSAGGRDLAALKGAIERLPGIRAALGSISHPVVRQLSDELGDLSAIAADIGATVCDEPPFSVREGGVIRDGADPEVDRLRGILSGGRGFLAEIEAREREKTGIRTLRIGYNKVFGYYIEVSNSFRGQVPDDWIRKQTLVNGERYITPELKDLEQTVLTAQERVRALEYELFNALRLRVAGEAAAIQSSAAAVAEIDALASLAYVAEKNNYCCPEVDDSGAIEIRDGRHPVVEQMLREERFVPNDTLMGEQENRVAIITGPNMAGKSTYMRQVALIVLMAQMGAHVPAASARIGICDRIFTRIGASDDLASGQSTFMVEMREVGELLHHATSRSLLILDEIGRGTSTYDGMAIARAVLEHCAGKKTLGARTLFATHYHELTELEGSLPGTVNLSVAVRARGEEIAFLRKIVPGGADRSYGVEVARMAGLPKKVVSRARAILKELETAHNVTYSAPREEREQISLEAIREGEVLAALRRLQPDTLSPMDALKTLYDLKATLEQG